MFRNLRSRRRPRYGAYVCAAAAAILLLLSVTLLHSRLTFSRHSHYQLHPNQTPPSDDIVTITTDRLHDDPDPGNKSVDDDRIDELDVVEEENDQSKVSDDEILRGVELEEDDSDQARVSGYYFDHVMGVIRRAFDKRSIDQWEDYVGFDVGLGEEDKSKRVFGSDDVPVDEDVRRKVGEITGVEDALLLKTKHRVSPLREGWSGWFDAKSDFLKRDRMFKSTLELLNPLNNPMLQDPDVAGVSGLTRGDRMVQKAMFNEFKNVPFLVKKPLGIVETTNESKMEEDGSEEAVEKSDDSLKKNVVNGNVESRNEIKRAERRTLDDNASNRSSSRIIVNRDEASDSKRSESSLNEANQERIVESNNEFVDSSIAELDHTDILKNAESNALAKSEFSGLMYADGKRWGYFPGLHPHLSFSNFMDAFFRKGKCSMRVFMVWNSPPWMYGVRHQRGLESLLLHHRDACVVLFSETIELDFFKDFVKDGFKVAVAMPNLDELLKNTPTHIFASVWFEWRKTSFYSTHYSELIRLAALYKYGGVYLDSDILVLKPLSSLNNSVGLEEQVAESSLNGAVMAFRKHSPFIMECLTEFYSTYDDSHLRWNGADLLTRISKKENVPDKKLELQVQPSFIFFPVGSQNITRYFTAPATEMERAQQDTLFQKILNQSFTFHFWNSLTSSLVPEPESLVMRFFDHTCIRCSDVL